MFQIWKFLKGAKLKDLKIQYVLMHEKN
jgi:hypothetical protein